MAHISSIGAAMYSDLSFGVGTTLVPATYDASGFAGLFTTLDTTPTATAVSGGFVRMKDVREFPAMGTPPNVVKVPVFGQSTSQSIQGQADAPSLEITVNYVAVDWDDLTGLGYFVNDGVKRPFRFTLLQEDPGAASSYASSMTGFGNKNHTTFYWLGKIEAVQVKPSLTDATTATVTLTAQSDFYGAFTHA